MSSSRGIAIAGLGCLCGAGMNLPECLESMFRGARNPRPPQEFVTDHPVVYPVLELPRPLEVELDRPAGQYTRTSRLALAAAYEALSDAGLTSADLGALRVGVCVGTTVGCALNCDDFYRAYKNGDEPGMGIIERFLRSNPANVIARQLGLDGPCQTIVNACSSGTDAFGIAAGWLRSGACDVVIAGGADELSRVTYAGFSSLMITDSEPCKPFDARRKGLNLGEGAGMAVLVRDGLFDEQRRGTLLGYGSACDAYHLTAPHPEGIGLKRAIGEALSQAAVAADEIAFVNAHGTATPDNDRAETRVLAEVLPGIPFHSTKGFTGHTLGAAGAIEAVFTLAFLERGEIPASIGFGEPDPELPLTPVTANLAIDRQVALSESLAFGGNNAVVVLGTKELA